MSLPTQILLGQYMKDPESNSTEIVQAVARLAELYLAPLQSASPAPSPKVSPRASPKISQLALTPLDSAGSYTSSASSSSASLASTSSAATSVAGGAADAFEKTYAKDWLIRLIARGEEWVEGAASRESRDVRARTLDTAALILSRLAEVSEAEDITRHVHVDAQTTIELNDALLLENDPTSVGLQSWGSSILLARRFATHPELYGLSRKGKQRVLELGCGTGLLSLAYGALVGRGGDAGGMGASVNGSSTAGEPVALADKTEAFGPPTQQAQPTPAPLSLDIVATDYHDAVLKNLATNIEMNAELLQNVNITTYKLNWSAVHSSVLFARKATRTKTLNMPGPLNEPFDTIIAADVVYAPEHASWLYSCVSQLLRKPTSAEDVDDSTFHLFVPIRPTHNIETYIDMVFPHIGDLDVLVLPSGVTRTDGAKRASEARRASSSSKFWAGPLLEHVAGVERQGRTRETKGSVVLARIRTDCTRSDEIQVDLEKMAIRERRPLNQAHAETVHHRKLSTSRPTLSSKNSSAASSNASSPLLTPIDDKDLIDQQGGWRLAIKDVVRHAKTRGVGRADEESYVEYFIGWC